MNRVLFAILLFGCGGKNDSSSPGSGSGVAATQPGPKEGDPSTVVVQRAFAGKKPTFPLLSKDGNQTAVEIITPAGLTQATTYSIGFVGVGADAWSGGADGEQVTLVDGKLIALLLDSDTPTYDSDSIAKAAKGIVDRTAEFTPFERSIDAIGIGDAITAGPFTLRVEEAGGAITVTVRDGATAIATDKIDPVPMGHVAELECVALPHARRAWFDGPRKRLLVEVGWNPGPDQCNAPDERFRLYGR
jgi:hypothetical protein